MSGVIAIFLAQTMDFLMDLAGAAMLEEKRVSERKGGIHGQGGV